MFYLLILIPIISQNLFSLLSVHFGCVYVCAVLVCSVGVQCWCVIACARVRETVCPCVVFFGCRIIVKSSPKHLYVYAFRLVSLAGSPVVGSQVNFSNNDSNLVSISLMAQVLSIISN